MEIKLIDLKDNRRVRLLGNALDVIELSRTDLQWVLDNQAEFRRAIRFLDGKEVNKCT